MSKLLQQSYFGMARHYNNLVLAEQSPNEYGISETVAVLTGKCQFTSLNN